MQISVSNIERLLYMPVPLDNQTTCQHASLRFGPEQLDIKIRGLVDTLEDAYYNHWKLQRSKTFLTFDMQETLQDSKALFDRLHGIIWNFHFLLFHIFNTERLIDERISGERYRYVYDEKGVLIKDRYMNTLNEIQKYQESQVIYTSLTEIFQRSFEEINIWV